MSETDHAARPLSPEEVVRARLVEGRLFEARFLLKRIGSDLQGSTFRELEDRIEKNVSRARELVQQAEDLVRQDRLDDAVAAYDAVRTLAMDYPGLDQALEQLQVRRSLGPLQAHGDSGEKQYPEPVRHEREEVCGEKNPPSMGSGRFPGMAVLGSVVGLAVLVTLAVILFQAAHKTDSQPVQPVESEMASGEGSLPPASAPVGTKNNRARQSSILPETIIAPPITDSLPVPEMAAEKPVHAGKKSTDAAFVEMMPLPVFAAGQEQIRVRFLPFYEESDEVNPAPDRPPASDSASESSLLSPKNEATESTAGLARNKAFSGQENPLKHAEPLALNPDGTYTVRPGDNLGGISLKVYGTSQRWREIFDLNRDILPSTATLRVGQHLKIRSDASVSDSSKEDATSSPELSEKENMSEGTIEERE